MKKIIAVLFGAIVLTATICSSPARGATRTDKTVCPDWTLRSVVTGWTDPAEGSKVVSDKKVVLTKPVGGGTEFAAKNLGLEFDTPTTISVHYHLDAEADYEAGAVRLFYYEAANPDTLYDATSGYDVAVAKTGVLEIEGVEKIGAIGLVYDASNNAAGKVTFVQLKIGKTKVAFKDVCVEPSPSATPTPTPTVTASPDVTPSATATTAAPAPSVSTSLVSGPSLPVTGAPMYLVMGVGALLLMGGVAGLLLARKRRQRFEA
jgi:LPXTG-motif cell wall-anchored protein